MRQLETEIARMREELVTEADRRRHELLDVKVQIRRHAPAGMLPAVPRSASSSGSRRLEPAPRS